MTKLPLVLVVDDEEPIRQFLRVSLKDRGFAFEDVGTAEGALFLVASLHPDVVLVDLGLPDRDGKDLVAQIRLTCDSPIVVISARDQEAEKVAALDAGADDYLTKPFGVEELVARLKVALRHAARNRVPTLGTLVFGDLVWNAEDQRVLLGGEPVHLTPLEYKLLAYMVLHPGRVLTHGTLLREVWGLSNLEYSHYVRIAVGSLRKKLRDGTPGHRFIETEIGTGYRFLG